MLSILIPAFNAQTYLSSTLDSLLSQNECDFEIIICDDGSTDKTATIGSNYLTRDRRVTYFRQAHSGAAAARNAAFSASRGKWVVYFDGNDISCPGSLGAMVRVAQTYPSDIVYCRWSKLHEPANNSSEVALFKEHMPGWLWLERAFLYDYPTYTGCFLLPRTMVEKEGGWDERLSFQDDMEFYARLIARTDIIRFCDEARFIYRQGVPGSVSRSVGTSSSESHYLATALAVQHLLRVRNTKSARAAAVRQLMLVSYTQHLGAPGISRKAEMDAKALAAAPLWRPWLPGGPARRILQVFLGWRLALKVHSALKRLL